MPSFVDSHKVVVKKNAFSVHPSAQNGSENRFFFKNMQETKKTKNKIKGQPNPLPYQSHNFLYQLNL